MPLFKDNETFTLVYRQHEYNAEALDGKISKVEDTAKCAALQHTPNASWSYDVVPLQIGYADILWESFKDKVGHRSTEPVPFISIVLLDDVDEYTTRHTYRLLRPIEEVPTKTTRPMANIKPPKKTVFAPREPETVTSIASDYGVRLVRDGETTTHTFKSPNLR
jgi:hypothetical protein